MEVSVSPWADPTRRGCSPDAGASPRPTPTLTTSATCTRAPDSLQGPGPEWMRQQSGIKTAMGARDAAPADWSVDAVSACKETPRCVGARTALPAEGRRPSPSLTLVPGASRQPCSGRVVTPPLKRTLSPWVFTTLSCSQRSEECPAHSPL